jgi:hypothetical protein
MADAQASTASGAVAGLVEMPKFRIMRPLVYCFTQVSVYIHWSGFRAIIPSTNDNLCDGFWVLS